MKQKQDIFTVLNGAVRFIRGKYNLTSDAVWLAASVDANRKRGASVLDVGIGTGGAALSLMARMPNASVAGIDISDDLLSECRTNAALNGRTLELISADIMKWKTDRTFDIVITNPPYFQGMPRQTNAAAHHNADLARWIAACARRVAPRGFIYCIADAAQSAEIIAALHSGKMGDISITPLFGAAGFAERALISGRLGTRGKTKIYRELSMNDPRILREMNSLQDTAPGHLTRGAPQC
jgi:tRNA1(Val) A37 N6-methylase TrmN6